MQPAEEGSQQSFIVQGAITSLSREFQHLVDRKQVSKTLHHFFRPKRDQQTQEADRTTDHLPLTNKSYQERTSETNDALAKLHIETNAVLVSLGLNQAFAPNPTPRQAGRPLGSRDSHKRRRGFLKKAEPTAAVKLRLGSEILERQKHSSESLASILTGMGKQYGCSVSFLRRLKRSHVTQKLANFVAHRGLGFHGLRQQGSNLASSKHTSKSEGKRLPGQRGYLGKTDHHKSIWQATRIWAQIEEANGHGISKPG